VAEAHEVASERSDKVLYDPRIFDRSLFGFVGLVSVRYRLIHFDANDSVLSTGDWTAFDFEMVAPPSGNSLTVAVALAEQTGESNGTPTANDSKLTGSVTGNLPQIVIEFDHNGNGTVDGTSNTELDGKFTYKPGNFSHRPTGLETGEVTINARVKEYDQYSAPVYSVWTPITFTLEDEPDTSLRIDTLSLADDTGNSNTDGATSNATITGTLVGGESVASRWRESRSRLTSTVTAMPSLKSRA
jgi:hypothetical protein